MAPLKPNEKRLMLALGGVLFLVANFWAWTMLQDSDNKAAAAEVALRNSIKSLQNKQALLKIAQRRDGILATYLKRYPDEDLREVFLSTFIGKAAQDHGVTLAKQQPLRTEGLDPDPNGPEPDFIKSGYTAEVSGSQEGVLGFIHELHNPAEFLFVKLLKLSVRKSAQQDGTSELVCNFTIQKFWHPDSQRLLDESRAALAEAGPAKNEQHPGTNVRPNGDAPPAGPENAPPPLANGASPATVRAEPPNDSKSTVQ